MTSNRPRWLAVLRPKANSTVEYLLSLPLGLDVWERHADRLIVAADEGQLDEIERRLLADVERLHQV